MKIENFEKAKEIKEKIDALQEQLEQVKIAINQNKKPSGFITKPTENGFRSNIKNWRKYFVPKDLPKLESKNPKR